MKCLGEIISNVDINCKNKNTIKIFINVFLNSPIVNDILYHVCLASPSYVHLPTSVNLTQIQGFYLIYHSLNS